MENMTRIPLEDNFTDAMGEAQRGRKLTDAALARPAGISPVDLAAIKEGEVREPAIQSVARVLGLGGHALMTHPGRREWHPERPGFARGFAMTSQDLHGKTGATGKLPRAIHSRFFEPDI